MTIQYLNIYAYFSILLTQCLCVLYKCVRDINKQNDALKGNYSRNDINGLISLSLRSSKLIIFHIDRRDVATSLGKIFVDFDRLFYACSYAIALNEEMQLFLFLNW